ncbi:uncharacterized protein [Palaemon carinicauda]|uniref:uncharacterized protein n=1 Tax=Palaemon carinicauda TaxID=392227 RepID=UPI0035B633C9
MASINFRYLGSTATEYGDLGAETNHRTQAGWKNWKKLRGALCDRRTGVKPKGKAHRTATVARPATMHGTETRATKTTEEKKMDVAEMRTLRWMCGATRRDKTRNEVTRGTTGARKLSDEIQESRQRWHGHATRRDEQHTGRRAMEMLAQGTRRRGRPKQRWVDCTKDDPRSKGPTGDEVRDRGRWRKPTRNTDPI